jgi:methyl-accepting chemotaxis protein
VFGDLLSKFVANLVDALVYVFIAGVTLTGLFKCLIPVWKNKRMLSRAIHRLELGNGDKKPAWQEERFLGKSLETSWQRFLLNAEQLDARGLPCNVEDYINDETVVHNPGHSQLAELIPSLLTSLGILGTFIGLMRGLSSLDMTNAARIMEGIPALINGMSYAFITSIAGITCSLAFNMLHRITVGGTYRAMDDFSETFSLLAMQRPLDSDVQLIIQGQDRNVLLHRTVDEMGGRLAGSMESAIGRAMQPVTMAMDNFIMGATQEQIEGVRQIVGAFIEQMNESLGGQFLKLGQTIAAINQSQTISQDHLEHSMTAAQSIVSEVTRLAQVSQEVMERFEAYVSAMQKARQADAEFSKKAEGLLDNMHKASEQQAAYLGKLQEYQAVLQGSLQEYVSWSDRILGGVGEQAQTLTDGMQRATDEMQEGSRMLAGSYSSFVENISEGLARALGMFDENMHSLIQTLNGTLEDIGATVNKMPDSMKKSSDRYGQQVELYVSSLSQLQQAVSDIARTLEKKPTEKSQTNKSESPTALAEGA